MNGKAALAQLQAAEVQTLPVDAVQVDEAMQPRVKRVVPYRHWGRTDDLSAEHTATMRQVLEAAHTVSLEPILVAHVDGKNFVVDGHHRLRAYQLAGRKTIPARVVPMARTVAVMATKLANCTPRALEMHEHQRREAAWQYMADVTMRGKGTLPNGESRQTIASLFHIGKTTVHRMLEKLPTVNVHDYTKEARDPGTGFPCWRYVIQHGSPWKDLQDTLTMDQWKAHKAEKLAAKIGGLREASDADVWQMALALLERDANKDDDSIRKLAYDDSGDF